MKTLCATLTFLLMITKAAAGQGFVCELNHAVDDGVPVTSSTFFLGTTCLAGDPDRLYDGNHLSFVPVLADIAALNELPCSGTQNSGLQFIVESTDEKYQCRDPGTGFAKLLVASAAGGVSGFTEGHIAIGSSTGSIEGFSDFFIDTTNARVGIGTDTPGQNLLPGSTLELRTDDDRNFLQFYRSSDSIPTGEAIGQIEFYAGSSSDNIARILGARDGADGGRLRFQTKPAGNPTVSRFIINQNGQVGITSGTVFPVNTTLFFESSSSSTRFSIGTTSGNDGFSTFYDNVAGSAVVRAFDGGAWSSILLNDLAPTTSGFVGIGTTSPDTRLDIGAGALTFSQMTACPATVAANSAALCCRDDGGGKTECGFSFNTGFVVIATEP